MRRFHAAWFMGGSAVLALAVWTMPVYAQGGSGTGSSMTGGGGTGGGGASGGGLGGAGAGGGGLGSGTGTGGSNFLQNPTNFLGGTTGTGTGTGTGGARNFGGGGGGGASSSSTTGSAFQGISSSNLFGTYFTNPQAMGTGTGGSVGAAKTRFGAALNTIPTQTISGGTGASGFNRGGTASLSSSQTYPGSSNIGVRRAPAYSTTLGFDYRPPAMSTVHPQIRAAIADSTKLPSKDSMDVAMDGDTIVLRGTAGSERERRLAEALIRLTPGVHDVRNDLEVREGAPAPRPIP